MTARDDIAAVAAGLTEAQRKAILRSDSGLVVYARLQTLRILLRLGLINQWKVFERRALATPRGHSLWKHLKGLA